jgi:putative pyruvate formate lyase activating enzyme
LREIFLALRDKGVHNINLVTATHFVRPVAEALDGLNLGIPVCWNSSGYEALDSLKRLEGLVQVYMPDFKYSSSVPAQKYSAAPDYPEVAAAAVEEMFRQVGEYRLDDGGILQSGVIVRHLILPGLLENSFGVIDHIARRFHSDEILFSLMSQYTPMPGIEERFPELARPVTADEAEAVYEHLLDAGIEDGYYQDTESSGGEMIPVFDLTGL